MNLCNASPFPLMFNCTNIWRDKKKRPQSPELLVSDPIKQASDFIAAITGQS